MTTVDPDRKMEQVRAYLRRHHANVRPDASFAARVAARLESATTADVLGRTALKLLPASLALVGLLAWASLVWTPSTDAPASTRTSSSEVDVLLWVLEEGEGSS